MDEKKPGKKLIWWHYLPMLLPMAALLLLRATKKDPLILIDWELIIIFGYIAAYSDFFHQIVPNRLVLVMLGVWIVVMIPQLFLRTDETVPFLFSSLMGLLFCGIIFLLVYLVSRKGIGGGDVKFMSAAGLYLGIRSSMTSMLLGSILAAAVGLTMILLKRITPKERIPLIPFLYAGILLSVLFL